MASKEPYKKAVSLVLFVALLGAILVFLGASDVWLHDVFVTTPMSNNVLETSLKIIKIVLSMMIVIALVRFVAFMLMRAAARRSAQAEVSSLLKTVFSIIIYIIAFFVIFQTQYPDVSLTPLFTGSTILGIVVGLALQDTLGNLFAGIAMQADQPFQVGDVIAIPNRGTGVVESVSWRGVKIRTFQNKLFVISNSVLGKESFEVAPRDNLNARIVFFNTTYTISPAKTVQLVQDAVRGAENASNKKRPIVRIRNLGDNGIDWEIKYWLDDYSKHNDTDALIRERIWYAFQREKLEFAFPTRTIHIQEKLPEVPIEEKINVRSERLNRVPVFTPLSDAELEKLAGASKSRVYAAGESIVRQGAEGNSMFVILRGTVSVQIAAGSRLKTINTLTENDFFGEMSLLTGQPRSATVVANTETEVLMIGKRALKPILESNETLVHAIVERIEERREILEADTHVEETPASEKSAGVMRSIRKFFGLRAGK